MTVLRNPSAAKRSTMAKLGIYLISDGGYLRKRRALVPAIERALEGGNGLIRYVQLREQHPEAAQMAAIAPALDSEVLELAENILPLCEKYSAKLLISRRIDLAKKAGAAGVHLGKGGPTLEEAKSELGANSTVGYSAHSIDELQSLNKKNYSYALLSPIFKPFSKNVELQPLGIKRLEEACNTCSLPVFALGGITKENASVCMQAGAAGVATITSVLLSPDPKGQAQALAEACA